MAIPCSAMSHIHPRATEGSIRSGHSATQSAAAVKELQAGLKPIPGLKQATIAWLAAQRPQEGR